MKKFEQPQTYREELVESLNRKRSLGTAGKELAKEQLELEQNTVIYQRAKIQHREDVLINDKNKTEAKIQKEKEETEARRNEEIFNEIRQGNPINVKELTDLPDEIAKTLVGNEYLRYEFNLQFNSLTSLSSVAAGYLSKHKGYLGFAGLKSISEDVAEELAKHQGSLDLRGLNDLPVEIALRLSRHKGEVELGRAKYGYLNLDGLSELTAEAAMFLANHGGDLALNGLKSLTPEVAKHLARLDEGYLELNGLVDLPDEVAKYLGQQNGQLHLSRLKTLSDTAAMYLSNHTAILVLTGLEHISDVAAEHLARIRYGSMGETGPLLNGEPLRKVKEARKRLAGVDR